MDSGAQDYLYVTLEDARQRCEFARHFLQMGLDHTLLKRAVGEHIFACAQREWIYSRHPETLLRDRRSFPDYRGAQKDATVLEPSMLCEPR